MHNYSSIKKIVYLILLAISVLYISGDNHEYTRVHIEVPDKFIAEYEKDISKKYEREIK